MFSVFCKNSQVSSAVRTVQPFRRAHGGEVQPKRKFSPLASCPVYVRGVGTSKVTRRPAQDDTFEALSRVAIEEAIASSGVPRDQITALCVGNMLAPVLQHQNQLASVISSRNQLQMIDTLTVDTASGSGGAAVRSGVLALLSGFHRNVLAVGVEILTATNLESSTVTRGLAQASDWEHEGSKHETFMSLNDTLMQLYLERYKQVCREDFFYFAENSHRNAVYNAHAAFQKAITAEAYQASAQLGSVVRMLDACPTANGCAAVVLSRDGCLGEDVRVLGSDCRTDNITLQARKDPLDMEAVRLSTSHVLQQAGIRLQDVSVYETHDAYTIMSALALESCGFVPRGQAVEFAKAGEIRVDGRLPINTFGGLKARGHPVGASGVYQVCELYRQLTQTAPASIQVKNARYGLTSSFGGAATTVVTHLLGK